MPYSVVFERYEEYLSEIYRCTYRNLTNMTTNLTIIDDYPLTTYIFKLYITFLNELHNHNTLIKSRNTYTYNKIDLRIHTNANYSYLYHIPL